MKQESHQEQLAALSDIRSMMERSSRFISLSGLSGVFAGMFALIGATVAYVHLGMSISASDYYRYAVNERGESNADFYFFFFSDGIIVLIASLLVGILFTQRQARQKGQSIWDATAKRVLINLAIPLVAGGFFCLALAYHHLVVLVAPATLVFYGLALINASKYTLSDIRYLGLMEIVLGLVAAFFMGYGLLFWAIGFGVLHIVYGSWMYWKYER